MRTFFGLELPAATAMRIADWRDRQFGPGGRPVPAANFHVTLAFVGETDDGALERLCRAVDNWLAEAAIPADQLLLDRVGYWPRPGILWLGCDHWPPGLARLADRLRHLATAAGARRDRKPWQPHLTLFRACAGAPAAPLSVPPVALPYKHFTLFESRRGKSGVSYHPLQQWSLQHGAL